MTLQLHPKLLTQMTTTPTHPTPIEYWNESNTHIENGNISEAINSLNKIVNQVQIEEYMLIDSTPSVPKELYVNALFNIGTLLKQTAKNISDLEKGKMYFTAILQIEAEHANSIIQITSIITQMVMINKDNHKTCIDLLYNGLYYDPINPVLHYNLGFIYQKLNNVQTSIIHYKIGLSVAKDLKITVNILNGLANIYRNTKRYPESLVYLLKAHAIKSDDPDINNQLGVVYTEMRRTDLAKVHYNKALECFDKTFISTDPNYLKSEIYLNYGHMYSYNGENIKSIECYNKSLAINPGFKLAFQNKLMNLNYIFDKLPDPFYISRQHFLVNKIFTHGVTHRPSDSPSNAPTNSPHTSVQSNALTNGPNHPSSPTLSNSPIKSADIFFINNSLSQTFPFKNVRRVRPFNSPFARPV